MTAFNRSLWMFVLFLSLAGFLPAQSAWLGIDAQALGDKVTVTEVLPDSPAKKAGLKVGDVLLSFEGKPVKGDLDGLAGALSKKKPGSRVRFLVLRGNKQVPVVAVLGTYPSAQGDKTKTAQAPSEKTAAKKAPKRPGTLGVGIAQQGEKIWVETVNRDSSAERAGFKPGDRIVSVEGRPVKDVDRLVGWIRGAGAGSRLDFVVRRGDQTLRLRAVLDGGRPAKPGPVASQGRARPSKGPLKWLSNYATAVALSKQSGRPLLIDFAADWCQPCKLLEKSFQAKEVAPYLRACVLLRVDVDKASRLADRFGVSSIPHVVLRSAQGKTLGTFTGYLPPDQLARRLARFLGSKTRKESKARAKKRTNKKRAKSRPARDPSGKKKASKSKGPRKSGWSPVDQLRRDFQRLLKRQRALEARLDKVLKILEKIK